MHQPASRTIRTVLIALLLATFCAAAAPPNHGEVQKATLNYSALRVGAKAMVAVVVEIKEGFHAQSHAPLDPSYIKFEMKPVENAAITFGDIQYPTGKVEDFGALGKLSVYTGRVVLFLPITVKPDAKPGPVEIAGKFRFQACDKTKCYRPETLPFSVSTEIVPANADVKPNEPELFKGAALPAAPTPPEGSGPATTISGKSVSREGIAVAFFTAFLVGIIFNVMPCVLPVLPLKAIGFYEVSQHNRARSVAFGAVFSLGLVATFAVFGLLIFVFKAFDWGGLFTKPWFTFLIVIVLLGMAISTFGWFTVNVPTGLYNISPRHDTFLGNFEFGILTALLSTPCTFGMFVGLLAWALNQPSVIGVLILVTVGVGMASPYFVLSALPEVARRFPRTGPWAELVKQMMAFLLLLAAVYFARPFLGRIVHGEAFWWLPFLVIVAAAGFLVVRTFQYARTAIPRFVGVFLAILLLAGSLKAVTVLTARPFEWLTFSAAALEDARSHDRIVLVEFTADWCGNCQWVEANVLKSKTIVTSVKRHDVLMLKADVTRDDAPARPLLDRLNPAGSIPLTVIYVPHTDQPIELTGIYSRQDLQHAIDVATLGSVVVQR